MNKILNRFTNKTLALFGFFSSVIFFLLIPRDTLSKVCSTGSSLCIDSFNLLLLLFMIGVTIFIPSIIMLKLKNSVFDLWRKTFIFYIVIYLLTILLVPWYLGDEFFHIQKDLIALWFSIFYLVFSIILIIYKSLKKNR